ncbi:hypothetical protein BC831DRAFT_481188, partial [Entophlyctis helioformis]
ASVMQMCTSTACRLWTLPDGLYLERGSAGSWACRPATAMRCTALAQDLWESAAARFHGRLGLSGHRALGSR